MVNQMIKSLPPLPEMVMKRDRAFQDKFRRAALMMVVSSDRQFHHTGRNAVGLAFESGAIIGILQCTVERSKYQSFTPRGLTWFVPCLIMQLNCWMRFRWTGRRSE